MKTSFSRNEFNNLFKQYYGPFCLYANRFLKDVDLSKDVVSEVFTMYWLDQDRLNIKPEKALAYIKTAIKHKAFNHLKHKNIEWSHIEYVLSQPTNYAESPDRIYNLEELYRLLEEALDALPNEYKAVFIRSVIEKESHEEIAERLQISLRSVNRYKQKVLAHLRLELKDYLPISVIAFILNELK